MLRRLLAFAIISRKINKLKKKRDTLIAKSVYLKTAYFKDEIRDLDMKIMEESRKFLRWVKHG